MVPGFGGLTLVSVVSRETLVGSGTLDRVSGMLSDDCRLPEMSLSGYPVSRKTLSVVTRLCLDVTLSGRSCHTHDVG